MCQRGEQKMTQPCQILPLRPDGVQRPGVKSFSLKTRFISAGCGITAGPRDLSNIQPPAPPECIMVTIRMLRSSVHFVFVSEEKQRGACVSLLLRSKTRGQAWRLSCLRLGFSRPSYRAKGFDVTKVEFTQSGRTEDNRLKTL